MRGKHAAGHTTWCTTGSKSHSMRPPARSSAKSPQPSCLFFPDFSTWSSTRKRWNSSGCRSGTATHFPTRYSPQRSTSCWIVRIPIATRSRSSPSIPAPPGAGSISFNPIPPTPTPRARSGHRGRTWTTISGSRATIFPTIGQHRKCWRRCDRRTPCSPTGCLPACRKTLNISSRPFTGNFPSPMRRTS